MALMAMWRHGLEAIDVMRLMCCPDSKKQVHVSVFVAYKSQKNNLSTRRKIVVMLWHRHRLYLSAVVLSIGHALSWLLSRKIRKATNTLHHLLVC
jgi:hypothetical protein